jgi:hypothetical protein
MVSGSRAPRPGVARRPHLKTAAKRSSPQEIMQVDQEKIAQQSNLAGGDPQVRLSRQCRPAYPGSVRPASNSSSRDRAACPDRRQSERSNGSRRRGHPGLVRRPADFEPGAYRASVFREGLRQMLPWQITSTLRIGPAGRCGSPSAGAATRGGIRRSSGWRRFARRFRATGLPEAHRFTDSSDINRVAEHGGLGPGGSRQAAGSSLAGG